MVRLVVVSPDGQRVLARPNGLAGWILPTIPVTVPFDTWTPDATRRARALLGVEVEPVRSLGADAWEVTTSGRLTAAGNTWIGAGEAGRLGADEATVRQWSETRREPRGDVHGG